MLVSMQHLLDEKVYYLSLDPGSKNFAYSIVELKPVLIKGNYTIEASPVETGLLDFTIKGTKNIQTSMILFILGLDNLVSKYKCRGIIMEQFQSRGFGTKLLELVNIMLGGIILHFQQIPVVIFSASAWKRAIKDKFDLDKEYKYITCTPHELDATYIGIYGMFRILEIKPFHGYRSSYFSEIARTVESVSKTPERNRRTKR